MTALPEERRAEAVAVLLGHEWDDKLRRTAHGDHQFHAFCEVCSGNVAAMIDALTATLAGWLAEEGARVLREVADDWDWPTHAVWRGCPDDEKPGYWHAAEHAVKGLRERADQIDRPEEVEGCDCAELCSMGPTCPGGMLARLPGSGCHRTTTSGQTTARGSERER